MKSELAATNMRLWKVEMQQENMYNKYNFGFLNWECFEAVLFLKLKDFPMRKFSIEYKFVWQIWMSMTHR